jgi:hypothetical protein
MKSNYRWVPTILPDDLDIFRKISKAVWNHKLRFDEGFCNAVYEQMETKGYMRFTKSSDTEVLSVPFSPLMSAPIYHVLWGPCSGVNLQG